MTAAPLYISSLQNPQVKNLVKLRNRRARDEQKVQIIEEPLVIRRARECGLHLLTVYYCREQLKTEDGQELLAELLREEVERTQFVELASYVMAKVSYRDRPEGLLVVAPQRRLNLADLDLPPACLILVVEGVEKPGNLGAIFRIADGAGVDAILQTDLGTDLYNPNVIRASRGAVFAIPTVEADIAAVGDFLEQHGIPTVATTPEAGEVYTDCDLRGPVALLLGEEVRGLSREWLSRAERQVRIPMHGCGDSLNVATSAALVLYEAVRQRNQSAAESDRS
ncbi:MAG: RNA methyltransferase [bacterium]